MKNLIFISLVFFSLSATTVAQEKKGETTQKEQQVNKKAPVITFEKTVHNYGTIKKGANGQCEFTFKNTGKEPLVLTNAKASCGCTVPSWPKEPIKKGQSATIKVKYNTNRIGNFSKSITVTSNATNSTVVLRIKGKVEAPAQEIKSIEKKPEGPVKK